MDKQLETTLLKHQYLLALAEQYGIEDLNSIEPKDIFGSLGNYTAELQNDRYGVNIPIEGTNMLRIKKAFSTRVNDYDNREAISIPKDLMDLYINDTRNEVKNSAKFSATIDNEKVRYYSTRERLQNKLNWRKANCIKNSSSKQ